MMAGKGHIQPLDVDQRSHGRLARGGGRGGHALPAQFGIERVVDGVAKQVQGQHGGHDGQAGQGGHVPRGAQGFAPRAHHAAPADHVGIAQPQERQAGFRQDGLGDQHGGRHDDGG
ncbi:hypothetical protein G6F24_017669 [Rhizopus arrhizus]|nr:hypothetical protein G6F24_017669 [Rhizopus arrhizus]